jgi:predicted O-methyltransferase YrrM
MDSDGSRPADPTVGAGEVMTQDSGQATELLERLAMAHQKPVVRKGRNVAAGNLRGWSLEFSGLMAHIASIPEFADAHALAIGRSLVTTPKLANLYLIMKYALQNVPGDIIEFGSYRGGSALFMARLLRIWGSTKKVFACDTYTGMPLTDETIDLHRIGDFSDVNINEIVAARDAAGLADQLVIVKGLFEDTFPDVKEGRSFSLVHVDCDIYQPIKYILREVDGSLSQGAYVAFDDPLFGSCLGAMEACEESYVQEKRLHAEQAYPHLVFRPKGA